MASVLAVETAGTAAERIQDALYDAKFVSDRKGWVVGAFGAIYHTTDGGVSWEQQRSDSVEHLYSVDFASRTNGWAVGRAGIILHTGDGRTWVQQESGTDKHLFAVKAISDTEAMAIGDWGAIFRTTDGGKTWTDRTLPDDVILNHVTFGDATHAWIVGEVGAVYASADGGMTWSRQETGTDKTLFGADFIDAQNGWAVGLDGLMIRTRDGGVTWELERGRADIGSLEQMGVLEALKSPSLYGIAIAGPVGIAVGDMGTILLSRDHGETWEQQAVPREWKLHWIRGVTLVPGANGVMVGSEGLAIPVIDDEIRFPGL